MSDFSDLDIKSALQEINEYAFEELIAELWGKQGWETEVTTGAGDKGVDVIAKMEYPVEQTHLIQVKRYASGNKVSSSEIQQYGSLRRQEEADSVIVVTTSSFSEQANELSKSLNVKLVPGDKLCDIIREEDAFDILTSYTNLEQISSHSVDSDESASESKERQNDIIKPLSERIKQELINTYTHHLEMTQSSPIEIEFINNDMEWEYYSYQEGFHYLYKLNPKEFDKAQSFIKNRMLKKVEEDQSDGMIFFYNTQDPTYDDVKEDIEIFIDLLEKVFGKNLGDLTRIEVGDSSTDDGYRAL